MFAPRILRLCRNLIPLAAICIIITAYVFLSSSVSIDQNSLEEEDLAPNIRTKQPIVIATVACSKQKPSDGTDPLETEKRKKFYEEVAVMMKSVILSAKYNQVTSLKFHIFLEHVEASEIILSQFKEFYGNENSVRVSVHFHSAVKTVPRKYWNHMIYHSRFRCGYVRSFFPSALLNEDSVIYLDTDTIVTGNIKNLWNLLEEMNSQQMIAIGRNNEPEDTNFGDMDKHQFGDIPHVPPKGLNNGVIAMNLTRLRLYDWEDKFLKIFQVYSSQIYLTVQRTMNILLFYNPAILKIIPCEMHFIHTHCSRGFTCGSLKETGKQIHLIHGANHTLEAGGIFRPIYEHYLNFNMTHDDFHRDLVAPVKEFYRNKPIEGTRCYDVLDQYLFKD